MGSRGARPTRIAVFISPIHFTHELRHFNKPITGSQSGKSSEPPNATPRCVPFVARLSSIRLHSAATGPAAVGEGSGSLAAGDAVRRPTEPLSAAPAPIRLAFGCAMPQLRPGACACGNGERAAARLPCCSQPALPAARCIAAPATDCCGFGAPCRRPPLPPVSSVPASRPSPAHGHGLPPPCGPAAGRHPGGGAGAGRVSVGRACLTASSWGSRQLDGDLPGPGKLPGNRLHSRTILQLLTSPAAPVPCTLCSVADAHRRRRKVSAMAAAWSRQAGTAAGMRRPAWLHRHPCLQPSASNSHARACASYVHLWHLPSLNALRFPHRGGSHAHPARPAIT